MASYSFNPYATASTSPNDYQRHSDEYNYPHSLPQGLVPTSASSQNPDCTSAKTILHGLGLNKRQIDNALDTSTRGIAAPIERFMKDVNDNIGNLLAVALGLSPCHENLWMQLAKLGLTQPPSEKQHESNRDQCPTLKAGYSCARNKPEQRPVDPLRQRPKQGVTKRRTLRNRRGSRDSSGPIDPANL